MHITSRLTMTLAAAALLAFGTPALAQGMGGHDMAGHSMAGHSMAPQSDMQTYKFELVGIPKEFGAKQHVVSIRIVHAAHNMPVQGVTFSKVRLDMSPDNMADMAAPVSQVSSPTPGVYSFAFDNSAWSARGRWALIVTANVAGEAKPVAGKVIFQTGN